MTLEPPNPKYCESLIRRVKGVISARVDLDEQGVGTVRVIAGYDRTPKLIIRDVESSLLNVVQDISRWQISVAQMDQGMEDLPEPERVRLVGISTSSGGSALEVKVTLQYRQEVATGVIEGALSHKGNLMMMAEATIRALEHFLPKGRIFALEDLEIVRMGFSEAVIVGIFCPIIDGGLRLTGSCYITKEPREAAVKATLNAINRQFNWIKRKGELSEDPFS